MSVRIDENTDHMKYTDDMEIVTKLGVGTKITMEVNLT